MHASVIGSARRRDPWVAFWIVAPVAAFALLWIGIGSLPNVECGEAGGADGVVQRVVIFLIAALSSTGCVTAAAWYLHVTLRDGRPPARLAALFVCALGTFTLAALSGALLGMFSIDSVWDTIVVVAVPVLVATALCLPVLAGLWIVGRSSEETSAILSAYLLGAGLFAYPASVLVSLFSFSGVGC